MIPPFLIGVLASAKQIPWKLVFIVAFALLVFLLMDASARLAAARERTKAQERIIELQQEASSVSREEADAFRRSVAQLGRNRSIGRDEIREASLHETRALFIAWAQSDRRLCNDANACRGSGG